MFVAESNSSIGSTRNMRNSVSLARKNTKLFGFEALSMYKIKKEIIEISKGSEQPLRDAEALQDLVLVVRNRSIT